MSRTEAGRAWLDSLPDRLSAVADRWRLTLGEPFGTGMAALVLPARRADGTRAVVKLNVPDRESTFEADALRYWDGNGAVLLLADDASLGALLLERCDPGHPLSTLHPDAALDVLIGLLPRLWKPAIAPFHRLADEAVHWSEEIEAAWLRCGRPFPRRLVDAAISALASLGDTQDEQVVLHQDLHADNVLAAQREPWLVIDPKPLTGEREFGVAPIVRGRELGHSRAAAIGRLTRLCAELRLDADRAARWSLAQSLAWAFDGDRVLPGHVDVAGWLADELG